MTERIAVTGLGIVSALGAGAGAVFERICAGERGFRRVSLFDVSGLRVVQAAEVVGPPGLGRSRLSRTDALALLAAEEALASAKLDPGMPHRGLVVGTTTSGMLETEAELLGAPTDPMRARRLLTHPLSATATALARELGPFSSCATVCSACSSGAVAIIQAAEWIASGKSRQVLAGGADALCRMTFAGFLALGALDAEPCRPFDEQRGGLTLGEGAGFLVLESEASARARGVEILAWLSGYAMGAEAHHITHPDASGVQAAALLTRAIRSAQLCPEAIESVNAHGTGTIANDRMEAAALRLSFGAALESIWVSSNKGQLGHTLGGAGAIEAAISVLTLVNGRVPPNAGLSTPEACDLRLVRDRAAVCAVSNVLSNSFGFGGMNAALLFERADIAPRPRQSTKSGWVVSAVSAKVSEWAVDRACLSTLDAAAAEPSCPLDPLLDLDPARSRRFARSTAFCVRAAALALEAAGRDGAGVGFVLGSAYGPVDRTLSFLDRIFKSGLKSAFPAEFPHLLHSASAGNASIYLGLTGPVLSSAEGVTSADAALGLGLSALRLGLCESVLVGAAETHDAVVEALAPALFPELRNPSTEGVGFALIEQEQAAASRGKAPLARLLAHASHHDPDTLEKEVAGSEIWAAPAQPGAAKLVLCSTEPLVERLIQNSAWANVQRVRLPETLRFHEARGGVGLALAAAFVATGAPEVLLVSGAPGALYVTRLGQPQSFA